MFLNLVRGDQLFELHILAWAALLKQAQLQGWSFPDHPVLVRREDNVVCRPPSEGWEVSSEDARNMAAALEAGLPDIPNFDARDDREEFEAETRVPNVITWWSFDMKEHLRDKLIPFFQRGGFQLVPEPEVEFPLGE